MRSAKAHFWFKPEDLGQRLTMLIILVLLYAGARGLFKSMDGGSSWLDTGFSHSIIVQALAIHPRNPNILYVGTQLLGYGVL